jgi:valyl-tRNA synthetase
VATVYRFIWDDLADWYIEQVKPRLYGDEPGTDVAQAVLAQTFDVALRLLHPVMPFITETLWRRLPARPAEASISTQPWPEPDDRATDPGALSDFALVQAVVGAVRSLRAEYGVPPGKSVRLLVGSPSAAARRAIGQELGTVRRLAKLSELSFGSPADGTAVGSTVLQDGTIVAVPLGDLVDIERECARLGEEVTRLGGLVRGQEGKLANPQFVSRAPADVVGRERQKLASWQGQIQTLKQKRQELGCD